MTSKVCAGGILLRDNKILLGKRSVNRSFYPGVWDIIGGQGENNETPEQTLLRELKEEIGIIPTEFIPITVIHESRLYLNESYEFYVFLVTSWTGEPRNLLPNEHSELGWFTIDEASKLNLALSQYSKLFKSIEKNVEEK